MFLTETATTNNIITAILAVFSTILKWFVDTLGSLESLFYNSTTGNLTFIGVLAIAALGISVTFLLINLIRSWLRFK